MPISFSALSPNIFVLSTQLGKAKKAIHVNRYWAMIEQFRNELEQRLHNLQSTAKSASLQELSKQLEDLFERALVAELIETRSQRKSEVFARVAKALAETPAPHFEIPADVPQREAVTQPATASNPYPMNPEIKVLPIPDGPPMPVSEPELADEPADFPAEPETIFAPPTPPKPVAAPAPKIVVPPAKPAPVAAAVPTQQAAKTPTSIAEKAQQSQKPTSLHQRLAAKNLSFGLNDRIAYIKHLFEGSTEDFNRVVNQLNTFENWQEAEGFIAEMVKPDYNWGGKEEYETRFVAQVRTRFEG